MIQVGLFDPPAQRPKGARDYQIAAVAGIEEALARHRSTLLVLATGLGKTFVASELVRKATGRVLVLAHLDTLVTQLLRELEVLTDRPWEREQGEDWASVAGRANVVASVQTLMRDRRLGRFSPDAFSLVIADEAHHYLSPSFRRPIDHFASAKVLGLTATPDRADRKAMRQVFESVAYKMDLADGVGKSWLVPIDCRPPIECAVDPGSIQTTKGPGEERDFVQADLDRALVAQVAPIVEAALRECGELRTVVFAPGVKTAHAAADCLNASRPGCARAIDGSMETSAKRAIIAAHKRGEFQYLCNCLILTEGYDDPSLQCIVDASPTMSRARCAQKVGRGTRPWPGSIDGAKDAEERAAGIAVSPKPRLRWIDLALNGDTHSLACPLDLLAGNDDPPKVRARAKKELAKKGGDPREALEKARNAAAARAARAKVKLELGSYDPIKRIGVLSGPNAPITSGQRRLLETRFGVTGLPDDMLAVDAQKIIKGEFAAEKHGLCNYNQRRWLRKVTGADAAGWSKALGRRVADAWKRNGRRPLSPEQLARVKGGGR